MAFLVNLIPELRSWFRPELRAGPRARIGLGRGRGAATGSTGSAVAWLLVEGDEGEVQAGSTTVQVGGRSDVFEGPGWSLLIPPKTPIAIRGRLRYAVVARAWNEPTELRVIPPDEVVEERRGSGADERLVRTSIAEGPLICGETINEPGRWSSWPPHRHEQEEVYLYRFDPAHGFGVQVRVSEDGEEERAAVVRDGHAERIRSGYHPVVAAPGTRMYYLWALAGEGATLKPQVHPKFKPRYR